MNVKDRIKDIKNRIKRNKMKYTLAFLVLVLSMLLLITWCQPVDGGKKATTNEIGVDHDEHDHEGEVWTCSMHPQVKSPEPGNCPICFMELVPLDADSDSDASKPVLTMTQHAIELAKINTTPVVFKNVEREILLNGKIEIDETTRQNISSRFSGRLEKLFINFTGIAVNKGDHVFEIYSPELFAAQDAYVKSYSAYQKSLKGDNQDYIRTEKSALKASESRLRLLGLTDAQINHLRKTLKAKETIPVFSEYSGVVIDKMVKEGSYVKTGTVIYSIADLSKVWIILDAYESDIQWLRFGQDVSIKVDAYPGKTYHGRISYIDPVLNEKTRTVKVRVALDNKGRMLKPGMLVTGEVKSKLTDENMIVDDYLADKWISPMHPQIIKDKPGNCDICNMPLVKASDLGYVHDNSQLEAKLVIPVSAPLITGKRAIVYVESVNEDGEYVYEGREVVLGAKTDDYYVVTSGLTKGELVVIEGAFKIDAAMQILAKNSMMNPADDEGMMDHDSGDTAHVGTDLHESTQTFSPEELLQAEGVYLSGILEKLSGFNRLLAGGQYEDAITRVKALIKHIENRDKHLFTKSELDEFLFTAYLLESAGDIDGIRTELSAFNALIYDLVKDDAYPVTGTFYYNKCDRGYNDGNAYWLDDKDVISNPYYGKQKPACGETVRVIGG